VQFVFARLSTLSPESGVQIHIFDHLIMSANIAADAEIRAENTALKAELKSSKELLANINRHVDIDPLDILYRVKPWTSNGVIDSISETKKSAMNLHDAGTLRKNKFLKRVNTKGKKVLNVQRMQSDVSFNLSKAPMLVCPACFLEGKDPKECVFSTAPGLYSHRKSEQCCNRCLGTAVDPALHNKFSRRVVYTPKTLSAEGKDYIYFHIPGWEVDTNFSVLNDATSDDLRHEDFVHPGWGFRNVTEECLSKSLYSVVNFRTYLLHHIANYEAPGEKRIKLLMTAERKRSAPAKLASYALTEEGKETLEELRGYFLIEDEQEDEDEEEEEEKPVSNKRKKEESSDESSDDDESEKTYEQNGDEDDEDDEDEDEEDNESVRKRPKSTSSFIVPGYSVPIKFGPPVESPAASTRSRSTNKL
jgi:hypothetical protein